MINAHFLTLCSDSFTVIVRVMFPLYYEKQKKKLLLYGIAELVSPLDTWQDAVTAPGRNSQNKAEDEITVKCCGNSHFGT